MKKNLLNTITVFFIIFDLIGIIFLSSIFYPLATDGFLVKSGEWHYTFENKTINFYMPIHIENKGPWAINDVKYQYKIFNGSLVFANNTQKLPDIINSLNTTININIDLAQVYNIDRSMIFKNQNVTLSLMVTGYYALNTIFIKVNTTQNLTWTAPIQNFSYYENYTVLSHNNYSIVNVPFSIFTVPYLNGTATVQSSLYVNSTFISSTNFTVILGKYYYGQAKFNISNPVFNVVLNNINYVYFKNVLEFNGLKIEFTRSV